MGPNGIRIRLDRPVALLLNEWAETYLTVTQAGYKCLIDVTPYKNTTN